MAADAAKLTWRSPPASVRTCMTRALAAKLATAPITCSWPEGRMAPGSPPRDGVGVNAAERPRVGAGRVAVRVGTGLAVTGGTVGDRTGAGVAVRGAAVGAAAVDVA